jgi:Ni,Fe-hydrogenase III large subunit
MARLAQVRAAEALRGARVRPELDAARDRELGIVRAVQVLRWAHRFFGVLRWVPAQEEAAALLGRTEALASDSLDWLEGGSPAVRLGADVIARDLRGWAAALADSRLFRMRTRGIGLVPTGTEVQKRAHAMVGPAGEDVHDRVLRRLAEAAHSLEHPADPRSSAVRDGDEAHAEVFSARGAIGLRVGRDGAARWETPTAAALPVVPRLLEGSKLSDAEVVLASLDLCATEADA